jgi:type II secretory pathway component GspD/PulD (secretin)
MLRFLYWTCITLFLFIPVFCTGVLGNKKTIDSSSVIEAKDNLLTVNVKDVPLNKVLMEIANQVPIKIVLFTPAEEHLVANFSQLPMVQGLKQLLSDYNYVFIYGRENPKGGGHEISKVIILSCTKSLDNNIAKSIVGHAKFMWNEKPLKEIPKIPADENGAEVVKVKAYRKSIVEELENAHSYISQLHEHIGQLEEKLEQQNEMLEKRLLAKFEEALKTVQYQQ